MEALTYLKDRELCKESWENSGKLCFDFNSFEKTNPEHAIAIVEQFREENPIKTRQRELLKICPDVPFTCYGTVDIMPCLVDEELNQHVRCGKDVCDCRRLKEFGYSGCEECKKCYWLDELEEE